MERRKLLIGIGALFAAPAIVRASSLMNISPLPEARLVTLRKMWSGAYSYAWTDRPWVKIGTIIKAADGNNDLVWELKPMPPLIDEFMKMSGLTPPKLSQQAA